MRNVLWYIHRLQAMNIAEVIWRVEQKAAIKKEKKKYYDKEVRVTEVEIDDNIAALKPNYSVLGIVDTCEQIHLFSGLDLFHNSFSYQEYRKRWNAGFQTANYWSEKDYSYEIRCGGRTDIGDIRTNWELNRHYQFVVLAKSYYVSGEETYISELEELFHDWDDHNLFLHGVEWTSAMEIAIRINSWTFTYAFLAKAREKDKNIRCDKLLEKLAHGILVMTGYVEKHLSKYSSANNHLIVELYAVMLSGLFFHNEEWQKLALKKLTEELVAQNYSDGVNKEMSLHYQTFIMEAYGLLMLIMKYNHLDIPKVWFEYLTSMSRFVADCCGDYGETIVFGDNDEGKILDLSGESFNHYHYVLDLMSCILPERYTDLNDMHENIRWLIDKAQIEKSRKKDLYKRKFVKCYYEGGYTLVRDKTKGILFGIDHAELGFGKLAAHGHADALSFQMFIKGEVLFTDAGTSNYHVTPSDRDEYRSTYCHNTATVDKQNQSEILGAFLWGKRANTRLIDFSNDTKMKLTGECTYSGISHKRVYDYKDGKMLIFDSFQGAANQEKQQIFLLNPKVLVEKINDTEVLIQLGSDKVWIRNINGLSFRRSDYLYSVSYNHVEKATRIEFYGIVNEIKTEVRIGQ